MKKLLAVILLLSLIVVPALSACDGGSKVTLTYANWNLGTEETNNIERRMIAAFEAKTGYKVEILSIAGDYDGTITSMAAQNQLPDVFMLSNLTFGLESEYLMDITQFASADPEWKNIPAPVEEAVHIAGGIYAVPFAMFMSGYVINEALLDENNLDTLPVSPTWEQFLAMITALKNPGGATGTMGINTVSSLIDWYPAAVDPTLGYFTWDGEKYNLNSDAFKEAMEAAKTLFSGQFAYDGLSEETITEMGYTDYVQMWNAGRLGARWAISYEIPDIVQASSMALTDMRFIATPGGRTPIVGDYIGISKTCANPQAAYELAKFMSFGIDGINQRLTEDKTGYEYNSLPLTTDAAVLARYFAVPGRMPGLEEAFENIDNGIVESYKVVPGYPNSRWFAKTGLTIPKTSGGDLANATMSQVIDACWKRELNYADYAEDLNTIANKAYADTLNSFIGKYTK